MTLFKNSPRQTTASRSLPTLDRIWPLLTALVGSGGLLLAVALLALVLWGDASDRATRQAHESGGLLHRSARSEGVVNYSSELNHPTPAPLGAVAVAHPTNAPDQVALTPTAQDPVLPPKVVPEAILLEGVPIGRQARSLSCELQAASDLAWYYGKPYTWDEIFMLVGYSPEGDPNRGFVGRSLSDRPGNVYPYGYGVYAEPIARALEQIGLPAHVHYGESTAWLRAQVANGHPVMVWAVGGMRVLEVQEWVTTDGVLVRGVPYEHTYLVIGYDAEQVWVQDPWDCQRRPFTWERFVASWDVLGRMAVVVDSDRTGDASGLRKDTPYNDNE